MQEINRALTANKQGRQGKSVVRDGLAEEVPVKLRMLGA